MQHIITRQQPVIVQEKNFWKTYSICLVILGIFGIANMIVSVHSMYSNNTSQELEFKRVSLTQEIRDLEQQRALLANIQAVQEIAIQEGYTSIEKLQYVETPSTQIVAQR